jgi:hypothetical protein
MLIIGYFRLSFFGTKYDINNQDEKTGLESRYSDMSHRI